MKKKIIIYGSGGLGKETILLLHNNKWKILGFIDDNKEVGKIVINRYRVLGNIDYLLKYPRKINVIVSIANPLIREQLIKKIKTNSNIIFPTIISKKAIVSEFNKIGIGSLIYDNVVITVDTEIGNYSILDVNCSIGHDVKIDDYVTIYPSANISGNVSIGKCSEIGVGSSIIQSIRIGEKVILGAGTVVINDLPDNCTAVGVPARLVKYK